MRHLDGAMIAVKAIRTVRLQRNSEDVKEAQFHFTNRIMTTGVANQLIYIDEC